MTRSLMLGAIFLSYCHLCYAEDRKAEAIKRDLKPTGTLGI